MNCIFCGYPLSLKEDNRSHFADAHYIFLLNPIKTQEEMAELKMFVDTHGFRPNRHLRRWLLERLEAADSSTE